jgi:hypothetical protein
MRRQLANAEDPAQEPRYSDWLDFILTNGIQFHHVPAQFQTVEMASQAVKFAADLHLKCILIGLRENERGRRILQSPHFHRALVNWTGRPANPIPTPLLFCRPFKRAVYDTLRAPFNLIVFERGQRKITDTVFKALKPLFCEFLTGLDRYFCIQAITLYPAAKARFDEAHAAAKRPKKRAKRAQPFYSF